MKFLSSKLQVEGELENGTLDKGERDQGYQQTNGVGPLEEQGAHPDRPSPGKRSMGLR